MMLTSHDDERNGCVGLMMMGVARERIFTDCLIKHFSYRKPVYKIQTAALKLSCLLAPPVEKLEGKAGTSLEP
jgi:hypothetical protein